MRKIFTTLLSVAAAVGMCVAAGPVGKPDFGAMRHGAPQAGRLTPAQRANVAGVCVNGYSVLGTGAEGLLNDRRHAPAKRAAANAPELITETPAGTPQTYVRSGDAYMVLYGYIFPNTQNGTILNTVMADDGKTVYIQNPLSQAPTGAWVKGTVDGTTISVPVPQYIDYNEAEGYGVILDSGKLTTVQQSGQTYATYVSDETVTDIKFSVQPDGSIRVEDKYFSTSDTPDYIVTAFYDDGSGWAGPSDYSSVYTPFDEEAVAFPADIERTGWIMTYVDPETGATKTSFPEAGIDGDKMYITGFSVDMPEAAIMGTIDGDKVTFASNQYVGVYGGSSVAYLVTADYKCETLYDPMYDEEYMELTATPTENLVMDYDAEAHSLKSTGDVCMLLNRGKGDADNPGWMYELALFCKPALNIFHEVAATPATPEIILFDDSYDEYEYTMLQMYVPAVDTEGNPININKLYYEIYTRVDDTEEPFVFYSDEYTGMEALGLDELTEIPYTFRMNDVNGFPDITFGGEVVYFYVAAPDAFGVKSIYMGGGERRESPVMWYDVAGVKAPSTAGAPSVSAVYGVDGIRRSAPVRGLNIVKMTDGSVRKVVVR